MFKVTSIALLLGFSVIAHAHFGIAVPDKAVVSDQSQSPINLTVAFCHPMERAGMTMEKPNQLYVTTNGKKTNLLDQAKSVQLFGKQAWSVMYKPSRPGLYEFVVEPKPYFEPAEDKYIIHYTKVMVPVFGEEGEWDKPTGLKTEIVFFPLTRPFANYVGNVFQGKVLVDGKPAPNSPVEVEFYNESAKAKAPNDLFVTQVVMTDSQGVFTYAVPWEGWWGFAALNDADYKLKRDGKDKDVELGAVLWTNFSSPNFR